jgi:hypothetical protein
MEGYGKLGRIKKVEHFFIIERPTHISLKKKGSMEEGNKHFKNRSSSPYICTQINR